MRSAALTTIKGGINRLRLKGGARADNLYDLVNGYVKDSGSVVARPGTRRVAKLDPATRGLCAFDGTLHTFCHQTVYVPPGFTLDLLVHPDTTAEVTVPGTTTSVRTFALIAGNWSGAPNRYVGFDDNTGVMGAGFLGAMTPVALEAGPTITTLYAYSPTSNLTNQTLIVLQLRGDGGPPASDCFTSLNFTDEGGTVRTLLRADANDPAGYDSFGTKEWLWAVPGGAQIFAPGKVYTLAFDAPVLTPAVYSVFTASPVQLVTSQTDVLSDAIAYTGAVRGTFTGNTFASGLKAELFGANSNGGAGATYPDQRLINLFFSKDGSAAASDSFAAVNFKDTSGVQRTFPRGAATSVDGYDAGSHRQWAFLIDPYAPMLVEGETYTVTVIEVEGTAGTTTPDTTETVGVSGNAIALEKIHFAEPFMGGLYVAAEFINGNVYHYWLQPAQTWEANKTYKNGDLVYPTTPTGLAYRASRLGSANPPWAANVPRYDGTEGSGYYQSVIEPTVYNDFYYTCIATTGSNPRSGDTEPAWPTVDGATVIESTDNPPDVNIPTTTADPTVTTPSSTITDRYGSYSTTGQVLR